MTVLSILLNSRSSLKGKQDLLNSLIDQIKTVNSLLSAFFHALSVPQQHQYRTKTLALFFKSVYETLPEEIRFYNYKLDSIKNYSLDNVEELGQICARTYQNLTKMQQNALRTRKSFVASQEQLKQLIELLQANNAVQHYNRRKMLQFWHKIKQLQQRLKPQIVRSSVEDQQLRLSIVVFKREYEKYRRCHQEKLTALNFNSFMVLSRMNDVFISFIQKITLVSSNCQPSFLQSYDIMNRKELKQKFLFIKNEVGRLSPSSSINACQSREFQEIVRQIRQMCTKDQEMKQAQLFQMLKFIQEVVKQSNTLFQKVESILRSVPVLEIEAVFGSAAMDHTKRLLSTLKIINFNFNKLNRGLTFYCETIKAHIEHIKKSREKPILIRNFSRVSSLQKDLDRLQNQFNYYKIFQEEHNQLVKNWIFTLIKNYKNDLQLLFNQATQGAPATASQAQPVTGLLPDDIEFDKFSQLSTQLLKKLQGLKKPQPQIFPAEGSKAFKCTLKSGILLYGQILIDTDTFFFVSNFNNQNLFFGKTTLAVPLKDILDVVLDEQSITSQINIQTSFGVLSFTTFFSLQQAFQQLSQLKPKEQSQPLGQSSIPTTQYSQEQVKRINQRDKQFSPQYPVHYPYKGFTKACKGYSLEQAFKLFCSKQIIPQNFDSYFSKLICSCQNKNAKNGDWDHPFSNFKEALLSQHFMFTRTVTFQNPIPKIPFFPPYGFTTDVQQLYLLKSRFMLWGKSKCQGVPKGDKLTVDVIIEVEQMEKQGEVWLQMRSSGQPFFSEDSMIGNIIKKQACNKITYNSTRVINNAFKLLNELKSKARPAARRKTEVVEQVRGQTEVKEVQQIERLKSENESLREQLSRTKMLFVLAQVIILLITYLV